MHKAQGLTLQRATYDAGPDEPDKFVGITFVALTRVRHPGHIVLMPFACSAERLTSSIATKPSLYARKWHEWRLRGHALATARRLQHLNPPASALAPVPPEPQKPTAASSTASPSTSASNLKTASRTLWPAPMNTMQQEQLRKQREAEPAPAAAHEVQDAQDADMDVDAMVLMEEEMEQEACPWDEEGVIDSDEERMADEMLVDMYV